MYTAESGRKSEASLVLKGSSIPRIPEEAASPLDKLS